MSVRREILEDVLREDSIRRLAIEALNQIDDYFEYRCKSKEDQAEVHRILEEFANKVNALTPIE
jgi:hypothetical protein